MAEKSARKNVTKAPARSLKEKRADKKAKGGAAYSEDAVTHIKKK
jgi:hypothetical protein